MLLQYNYNTKFLKCKQIFKFFLTNVSKFKIEEKEYRVYTNLNNAYITYFNSKNQLK